MRFKVGDYFYYKFWHDYWIIGKIIYWQMYAEAKILKDGSNASLLVVTL